MAENVIIHEISLSGYKAASDGTLDLGTWGSYGVEKLHCTFDEVWRDLTITAFFNVKGEVVGKALVGKDGYADVPWEATKENTFAGRIVFDGSMDGQRRVSTDLNFKVTNHSSIEDVDSVPTEDRWNQFVTQNKEYRDGAYEAATKAEARAADAAAASEDAQAAMRAAKASENAAAASENAAKNSEDKAKASADAAARSETNASASERAAAGSAAAAAASEGSAAESAKNAASAAKKAADESVAANIATLKQIQSDVTEKQNNAATSANAAADAEQGALAAQAAAETAVTNAGTAATRAETAAGTATAAATDAGNSADEAAQSRAAAETAAQAAKEAQAAAAAAKADAVKAQTAAQAAAKTAQDAQSAAEKARDDAQTARQGAEAARDAAAKSEANAKQSADTLAGTVENVAANTAAVAELREKKAEIDDSAVGADGWSSKHIVDMLCPKIEESGNPVQCYPVAGYPLGVKAKWEPVQEGSGTPYPAGGGKNLWGDLIQDTFISQQGFSSGYSGAKTTGKIPCSEGDDYTLSCATSFAPAPGNIGVLAYFDASDTILTRVANTYQRAFTLKAPANAAYLRASCYKETDADNVQLEKGSAATAYAPYENIRPIKGRDSVKVERCSANLLKIDQFATMTKYGVTFESVPDGGIRIQGTATANVDSPTFSVWHLPPGKYYGLDMGVGTVTSIVMERAGERLWINTKGTFEIMPGDILKYWYMVVQTGYVANATIYPYIVPGTTAPTTYTPYIGQTNTLTLPETVYGGEVDAVSGEGQETWGITTIDAKKIKFSSFSNDKFWNLPYHTADGVAVASKIKCSHIISSAFSINTSYAFLFTQPSRLQNLFSSVDELNDYCAAQYSAGTPVQIAYQLLKEPVPFTATGAQPIPALAGANTVLTDADSVTVTGRADPIKRITDLEAAVASIE